MMLESEGVQIFVSTHDYFLSKYIEVKRNPDSHVQFISLYKDENSQVKCEIAEAFELLEHNAIMDTFRQLYREEIGVALRSKIYKNLGDGIKTVEFILRYDEKSIVFLEAKKSCPNAAKRYGNEKKSEKFEEYYTSIVEKFVNSLQVYVAAILNRYPDASDVGTQLQKMTNMKEIQLKFVLVVKNAEDITWLAGPLAELKARLLQIRKIWNVEIAVLNEELASQHGLLC